MCSLNSINPLETTVLGYSTPQSCTEQPTQLYKPLPARKENHVFGQNKYNVTQKGKEFPDHSVNSVQGEQKCKVKGKEGDHSYTYKYKDNQSGWH